MFGGGPSLTSQYALYDWRPEGGPTFTDTTGKTPKSLVVSDPARTAIVGVIGQSIVAGLGGGLSSYTPVNSNVDQLDISGGLCWGLKDATLGVSGTGGSLIPRIGDRLRASPNYDRVIMIPGGVNSTSSTEWGKGNYTHRLVVLIKQARKLGTPMTHMLYVQGQAETFFPIPPAQYQDNVLSAIAISRALGCTCPWYIAQSTMLNNSTNSTTRGAQLGLVNPSAGRRFGGDIDVLTGPGNLSDGTHPNDAGAAAMAVILSNALLA